MTGEDGALKGESTLFPFGGLKEEQSYSGALGTGGLKGEGSGYCGDDSI